MKLLNLIVFLLAVLCTEVFGRGIPQGDLKMSCIMTCGKASEEIKTVALGYYTKNTCLYFRGLVKGYPHSSRCSIAWTHGEQPSRIVTALDSIDEAQIGDYTLGLMRS